MKNSEKEELPDSSATDEARRQLLQRVHGYTDPPSLWQLCQLAAMVGGDLPQNDPDLTQSHLDFLGEDSNPYYKEADRRMALVGSIWAAAVRKRREIQKALDETARSFDRKLPLYGPLKIGGHYLPRLPDWATEEAVIPFKRFLEAVVGMERDEDRMRWWRAYMKAKIQKDQYWKRWGVRITEEKKKDPEWCEPDDFPIPENLVEEALEHQRTMGFEIWGRSFLYIEGFRRWRLGMKSTTKRADSAHLLEDCVKKGLEEEKKTQK